MSKTGNTTPLRDTHGTTPHMHKAGMEHDLPEETEQGGDRTKIFVKAGSTVDPEKNKFEDIEERDEPDDNIRPDTLPDSTTDVEMNLPGELEQNSIEMRIFQ